MESCGALPRPDVILVSSLAGYRGVALERPPVPEYCNFRYRVPWKGGRLRPSGSAKVVRDYGPGALVRVFVPMASKETVTSHFGFWSIA